MVSGVVGAGCSPGDDPAWPAAFSPEELPWLPPRGRKDGWMGCMPPTEGTATPPYGPG